MTWRDYGYIVASTHRTKVVSALLSHPKTPRQISTQTNIGITHVSRTLKELVSKGLVYCINPNEIKGRVYGLTDKGEKVAKLVEEDFHK